jgi:hypothetical protein
MPIDVLHVMMLLIYDDDVAYTLVFGRTNLFQVETLMERWGNALKGKGS